VFVKRSVASLAKKIVLFLDIEIDLSWRILAVMEGVSRSYPPASGLLLDTPSITAVGSP
jgi:hypothetical protein